MKLEKTQQHSFAIKKAIKGEQEIQEGMDTFIILDVLKIPKGTTKCVQFFINQLISIKYKDKNMSIHVVQV